MFLIGTAYADLVHTPPKDNTLEGAGYAAIIVLLIALIGIRLTQNRIQKIRNADKKIDDGEK